MRLAFAILLSLFPALSSACTTPGISRIAVPVYPDRVFSPTYSYAFKVIPARHPGAPTVIVLPGGPGGTLLGHSPDEPYSTMALESDHFNVIYTDPRGAGCNQGNFSEDALTTPYLANDIASMVDQLKQDDYFIAGVSYGTILATQATDLIERSGLKPPRALVLEGTLGKSFTGDFSDYIDAFNTEWTRVSATLSPTVAGALSKDPLPFGSSALAWGSYIYNGLISGDVPNRGHLLKLELEALATKDPNGLALLEKKVWRYESTLPPVPSGLFRTIGCREIFKEWGHAILKNGRLQPIVQPAICKGSKHVGYDSADFPIRTPIVYFQGPHDHATPYESARHHFDLHPEASRTFVTISGAAHAPLTGSLRILGCNDLVWKTIGSNIADLENALKTCSWSLTVDNRIAK